MRAARSESYNLMGPINATLESSVRYLAADLADEGIRASSFSAGPVMTYAASGIDRFDELHDEVHARTPSGKLVGTDQIGQHAAAHASVATAPMSGSVVYADNGFHTTG